ncbi:ADP-ribosylation factor-like protein 2-binding protein isoform X1 [Haliotis asinina]|uniref:ADP-ribosylation factor-like protein 2-binding protein isoform X1 n=1 Tax=Haliotis asinina TaxID=109174 RepID=UPI00353252C0
MASSSNTNTDDHEPMDFQGIDLMEEDLATSSSNTMDSKFDITIGHIEDIIMEEEFQSQQRNFLEKYYIQFEDTEENKFVYTDIHTEYVNLVEKYLSDELLKRIPGFSMQDFSKQLIERKDELEGEIFEILLTFSDFLAFKEMFLDYRADKEGRTVDLSDGLTVKSMQGDMSLDGSPFSLCGHSLQKPQ